MNGLNRFVAGCECNRPTLNSIRASGYTINFVSILQTHDLAPMRS